MQNMSLTTIAVAASLLASAVSIPSAAAESLSSWQASVAKAIGKNQRYPRSAQMRQIEGKAKVRLIVSPDGTITSHEVVEATGQPVLDREIPKLVTRLNPLPALPAGQQESLSFVIPLEWALQ